jgi:hypothetical protein
MSTVIMHNVVSLDGFIADAKDQVGPLFEPDHRWRGRRAPCSRRTGETL